jgi:phosphate transport system substrate-binding protein
MSLRTSALLGMLVVASLNGRAAGGSPPPFDLSALPDYQPTRQVTGTIRNYGFGMGGLLALWEADFQKLQPNVRFDDHLPTSDAAIPALVTGVADLGPDGGEPIITETLSFFETHGHHPTAITIASGAYDVEGHSNGPVVYVNRDNPISRLTLQQLDGIFGAERTGGLDGFKWSLAGARGPEGNIRNWGQLGLGGEWADKPIQTYGHAPSGTTRFFQLKVMHNSGKWNPNYREYVESGSKMIGDDDPQQLGGLQHMLRDELAHDRYGIAWTVMPQARDVAGLKPIALAVDASGPYVMPSRESFQSRAYPLVRSIYMYLDRPPGQTDDPKLREFLLFILSRQGQERLMAHGGYLPLTAEVVAAQRRQLEDTGPVAAQAVPAKTSPTSTPPIDLAYHPRTLVSGDIRIWGHGRRDADVLGGLVGRWQAGFGVHQPRARIAATLRGDATAMGGLYTGAADVALMERDPLPMEVDGYLPVLGHPPLQITIATGSLDVSDHASAPIVFVHRDNPLRSLTLAQLDAILGADSRRGEKPARTWGDLGLGGAWKDALIAIYTFGLDQDVSRFLEKAILGGSQKWAPNLHEFHGRDASHDIVAALAHDRFGIALADLRDATAQVKAIALAAAAGQPAVEATSETVRLHQYPLTRSVTMVVDRVPQRPLDAKVSEFLRYVLSTEGQADVAEDGGYLPLTPELARQELEKLQ